MGMKRRDFLLGALGVVAGVHVSPLPWKLMDDVAIWTQNWAWVPRPESGAIAYTNAYSPLCSGGCGAKLRLVDAESGLRGVKVEGNPADPVTQGGICPVCLSGLQYFYNDAIRVKYPMKRSRKTGEWHKLTWAAAIAELTGDLKKLRDAGQASAVAAIDSAGADTSSEFLQRFLTVYGSANYVRMPSIEDSTYAVSAAMLGGGALGFDLAGAGYVLSLGAGLLEGFGSEVWSRQAYADMRGPGPRQVKLVMADARASNTASAADWFLACRPGTEGALALGLCHVLIKNNKVKGKGLEGFDKFKALVMKDYSPAAVAKLTGVAAGDVVKLAVELAAAKDPVVIWGRGKGDQPVGLYDSMAAVALSALLGAVGRKGGLVKVAGLPLTPWPKPVLDNAAQDGLKKGRLDGAVEPFARWSLGGLSGAMAAGKVKLLMIGAANPAFSAAAAGNFRKASKKVGKVVSFSPFMDETAMMADLILPAPFYLETYNDSYGSFGVPLGVYRFGKPAFKPLFKTKSPVDTLLAVAAGLGEGVKKNFPWKNFSSVLKFRAGKMYKDAEKNGFWTDKSAKPEPVKKVELYSSVIAQKTKKTGAAAMPHFELPASADAKKYPVPVVAYGSSGLTEDKVPFSPFMTKLLPDDLLRGKEMFVEVNPATGKKLGIGWGDRIKLTSRAGSVNVRVDLTERAMPGYVFIPKGLGHTAFDRFVRGKGANAGDVLEVFSDPLSGLPVWHLTRAKLVKS